MSAIGRQEYPPAIRTSEQVEKSNYDAWQEWLRRLTPDELVVLEEKGLTAPEKPRKAKRARRVVEEDDAGVTADIGEHVSSKDALWPTENPDPCEALMAKETAAADEGPGTPAARFEIDDSTRRDLVLLGYVLPAIIDAADPRLEASLIALALLIGARQGITIKSLEDRWGDRESTPAECVRAWQRKLDVCRASITLLRLVISPILASDNPRLEAESIAIAARFGLSGGKSMTECGKFYGVCKAAISARVRRWVKALGLALPRDCKEETENYVLFNVRKEKTKPITL